MNIRMTVKEITRKADTQLTAAPICKLLLSTLQVLTHFNYLTTNFKIITTVWITVTFCELPQMTLWCMGPEDESDGPKHVWHGKQTNKNFNMLYCDDLKYTSTYNAARHQQTHVICSLRTPRQRLGTVWQSDTQACNISLFNCWRLTVTYLQCYLCVTILTKCTHTLHIAHNGKLSWLRTSRTHTNI
jgi:hypothetical protein